MLMKTPEAIERFGSCELLKNAAINGNVVPFGRRRDIEAERNFYGGGSSRDFHGSLARMEAARVAARQAVPIVDWGDLKIHPEGRLVIKGRTIWEDLVWETTTKPRLAASADRTINKGGRPPKIDWVNFDGEVVRIANTPDGLPERPALHRHMMDFCSRVWGDDAPADSAVRDRLARLLTS
jgi:hypothetical protein